MSHYRTKTSVTVCHIITHNPCFRPRNPDDIGSIVKKLKPKSSYGEDDMSIQLLIKTILNPITYTINSTFETGVLPTDLKCAKVIPIPKSADPCSLNNYRPIRLLSLLSKILDRTM